jgi:hypothetical protein
MNPKSGKSDSFIRRDLSKASFIPGIYTKVTYVLAICLIAAHFRSVDAETELGLKSDS